MKRFFDREDTKWKRLHGCLHLYGLPSAEAPVRDAFSRTAARLEQIPGLGVQPVDYLHATVQRFDAFTEDLGSAAWAEFLARLRAELASIEPLELNFAAPFAAEYAVEAVGEPTGQWASLISLVSSAATECGLADQLTEPPYGPHYSLAYCIAETPSEPIASILQQYGEATRFTMDAVALVSVAQSPVTGIFSFEVLESMPLARAPW